MPQTYTYSISEELSKELKIGQLVEVELRKKIYCGLVSSISLNAPIGYNEFKKIRKILAPHPIINLSQLQLWKWMAEYYMCSEGEVFNVAVPSALKMSSQSFVNFKQTEEDVSDTLFDKELEIYTKIKTKKVIQVSELGESNFYILKSLADKDLIFFSEKMISKYTPKTELKIILNPKYKTITEALQSLKENTKQLECENILLKYLKNIKEKKFLTKKELIVLTNSKTSLIDYLIKKELLAYEQVKISRLINKDKNIQTNYTLSNKQQITLSEIQTALLSHTTILLNGVTASGKTLIYCKIIETYLQQQQQVLFLLPEISLTSQIISRIEKYFQGYVYVYHSKILDNTKKEIWDKVLEGEPCIILGARSASFLPFTNLGLVVVDEEHDISFKQKESAPHYNAKDIMIYFATFNNAKVILGSATPSIESLHNVTQKKFGYVVLNERYGNFDIPKIDIVDMKKNVFKKDSPKIFSHLVKQKIEEALSKDEQIIIFQNKRGYSNYFMCHDCGAIPYCKNCDVSLTYHKNKNILKCHYCNAIYNVIRECQICKSKKIIEKKYGTEQIEQIIQIDFPNHNTIRVDADTVSNKNSFELALQRFENKEANFLVGTQMISKGIDFSNISLVAIVDGDSFFNFMEYNATERAFQNILQVSGRAGRKNNNGRIYLQLYNSAMPILEYIKNQDYLSFCKHEMLQRKQLNYPPFTRMLLIAFKHNDKNIVNELSTFYFKNINPKYKPYFMAPSEPVINRIKNKYIMNLIGKLPKNATMLSNIKKSIKTIELTVNENKIWRTATIEYLVDF